MKILLEKLKKGLDNFERIQEVKYNKNNIQIKNIMSEFRKDFKSFSDEIAKKNNLITITHGHWQNSGNIKSYIWNRYKPFENNTHLVI